MPILAVNFTEDKSSQKITTEVQYLSVVSST